MDTIEQLHLDCKELYRRTDSDRDRLTKMEGRMDAFAQNCEARKEAEDTRFKSEGIMTEMKLEKLQTSVDGIAKTVSDYLNDQKIKKEKRPEKNRAAVQFWLSILSFAVGVVLVMILKLTGVMK